MFSILVLTLNEEDNLLDCLASVSWCDDIVILDSLSTDRTEEIAKDAGVRFVEREFDNYAKQRNFGLNKIDYKYPWLLMLDADETVTEQLKNEMLLEVANDRSVSLFRMRRKDYFMGRWIKYSSGYPTWFGRLIRIGKVHVEREINEEFVTDGVIVELQEHLIHHPFNKGFHAWFEKHNRYSSMEAKFMIKGDLARPVILDLFSKDPVARRKSIKAIVYRLPGRPFLLFIGLYIIKGGFLDGKQGFVFSLLRSFYEFMISCKIEELQRRSDQKKL